MITKNADLTTYTHLNWENASKFIIVHVSNEHEYKTGQKFWLRMNVHDLYWVADIRCQVTNVKILKFSDISNFESWALCDSPHYKEMLTSNNVSQNFENALNLMRKMYKEFDENEVVQVVYFNPIVKIK